MPPNFRKSSLRVRYVGSLEGDTIHRAARTTEGTRHGNEHAIDNATGLCTGYFVELLSHYLCISAALGYLPFILLN
jgi:hypothetical protein